MLSLDIATNPSASIRNNAENWVGYFSTGSSAQPEYFAIVSGELIKVEDYVVSILSNILDITRKFLGMLNPTLWMCIVRQSARSWQGAGNDGNNSNEVAKSW